MRIEITADDDTFERLTTAYEKLLEAVEDMPWREDLKEAAQEMCISLGRLSARVSGDG